MMSKKLTYITSHPKKAEELGWHLEYSVAHRSLELPEVQSLDSSEVVTETVKTAYELVKQPVLVEDISVRFTALGRLPGTFIKYFLSELGVEGLCRLLDGYKSREAVVASYFAFYDGSHLKVFSAEIEGFITKNPKGESGFGTDSIFQPNGSSKTWGQMTKQEQIDTSVRKLALRKLQKYLHGNF